jgi:hypothetical protein
VNITKVQNAPEAYAITTATTVRVSAPWKSSGHTSGKCHRIVTRTLTGTRVNPDTGEWEKYTYTAEVSEPIEREQKTRRTTHRVTVKNDNAARYNAQAIAGYIGNVE